MWPRRSQLFLGRQNKGNNLPFDRDESREPWRRHLHLLPGPSSAKCINPLLNYPQHPGRRCRDVCTGTLGYSSFVIDDALCSASHRGNIFLMPVCDARTQTPTTPKVSITISRTVPS